MDIKLYYSPSKDTHTIVFREQGVVIAVSSDKVQQIEANYEDAEETIFEATVLSRLENARGAKPEVGVSGIDLLYAVAELKSRLFE